MKLMKSVMGSIPRKGNRGKSKFTKAARTAASKMIENQENNTLKNLWK